MRSEAFWAYFDASARPRLGMRAATFAGIFEYLDRFERPVEIVETGCTGQQLQDGPPGSTILFDKYAEFHPGTTVHAIGTDEDATRTCRSLVSDRVRISTGDSLPLLARLAGGGLNAVDLLFLDSVELDYENPLPGAWRCMQELTAAHTLIHADTLVVVDGAPTVLHGTVQEGGAFAVVGPSRIGGKGRLIAEYARQVGATVHLHGYQTGWTGICNRAPPAQPAASSMRAIVIETAQGVFAVDHEDAFVGMALRNSGAYGRAEIERATSLISPDDNVLVVGAHIGSIVVPLAKRCRHVTAVEANPWTYKLLQCNLALNDAGNVTAHHFAAGEREKSIRFVMNRHNSGGSKRYPLIPQPEYFYDNPEIVTVDCFRLDDRLARHDYKLVFMDIEGSEHAAILGMPRILGFARHLVVEFLPHHLTNVAGITPEAFAAALVPFFSSLLVPSQDQRFGRDEFAPALRRLFDQGRGDEGLVFSK